MAAESAVSEDVTALVQKIIIRRNLKGTINIIYRSGSESGDGYGSKTVAVDITNDEDTLHVFIKYALNIKSTSVMPMEKLYENETYFFEKICPVYREFCKARGIENYMQNIPISYGASKTTLALENLKERHFALYDRTKCFNDAHIKFVFKVFAEFHAISYAFKDQETQKYEKLLRNIFDAFSYNIENSAFIVMFKNTIDAFISKLDPVKDKIIFDECSGLIEKLVSSIITSSRVLQESSILTQGDCHCNNIMFLYEDENKEKPRNIMLIDWQLIRSASPVFDLSYLFYSVASKDALDNLDYYLKFYHNELCKSIRLLGSDPNALYPFKILEKEWKQHCKFGLTMAFSTIRIMLSSDDDEMFDMEKMDFENPENNDMFVPNLKREDEYENRMKILLHHMMKNKFLE